MKPVLFSLPEWIVIAGTVCLGAVMLFLNRKQPKKNLAVSAAMFAGAAFLEAVMLKGEVKVPAYGFMIMLAFISGTFIAVRRANRWNIDPGHLVDAGLCAILFGILGARLLFIIQFFNEYFWGTGIRNGEEYNKFWNIFKIWQGGLVFYGGLAGAAVAIIILLRRRGISVAYAADLVLPSVILGLAITRIGCFLNGCCFGVAAEVPWTVTFPRSSFAHEKQAEDLKDILVLRSTSLFGPGVMSSMTESIREAERRHGNLIDAGIRSRAFRVLKRMKRRVLASEPDLSRLSFHTRALMNVSMEKLWKQPLPVHPTQIYASVTAFLIFGILLLATPHRTFDGQIGMLFGLLYSVNRFTIEIFRGDNDTMLYMTISQWLSIALFLFCGVMYIYLKKKGTYTPIGGPEGKEGKEG